VGHNSMLKRGQLACQFVCNAKETAVTQRR
jgi:hypothetical protein